MSIRVLVTGNTSAGVDVVHALLASHPDAHATRGRRYVEGWERLTRRAATQSKHPDRPWEGDAPGLAALCARYLGFAMDVDEAGRLRRAQVHADADVAYLSVLARAAELFPTVRLVLVLQDGRFDLPAGEAAVRAAAHAWAEGLAPLGRGLPDRPILVVDAAHLARSPEAVRGEVLTFVGLDPARVGPLPRVQLALRPPQGDAERWFRAVPEAEAMLQALGWVDGPPPSAIDVAPPVSPLDALADRLAADEDDGVAAIVAALAEPTAPAELWVWLLDRPHRPEALDLLGRARRHPDVRVRAALARCLVAHGCDREAAEVVAQVADQDWFVVAA